MAETRRKSCWEVPRPGPGTISGFFVAWLFVGAIVGLTIILMLIGKGPMPIRVVAYDLGLERNAPGKVNLEGLVSAVKETNPMVLALQGSSEEVTKELSRKLELKYFASGGSSAILSRYRIEEREGARFVVTRYGKNGRFGVVNMDLRKRGSGAARPEVKEAVDFAPEFSKTPHAVLVLVDGEAPEAPPGYVEAPAQNKEGTAWRIFIPESIKDNLKECYVPAKNKAVKDFSDRLPIVAHFVFHKRDFE